ncbi:MAG: hypothetical protein NTZ73_02530 [Candidatus Diapherotrites archaeon]|nr:hypothetical protein [Candidatus Diapherotrites archaeon]
MRITRPTFAIVAAMLFSLLLISGCDEMSRNEKNLCYSMASKSYSYVPKCKTEQECYGKVNALFSTDLGYAQEATLYETKNSVARSWFYFNKANEELSNISGLCSVGDAGALPGSINQLRFYFDNAFFELDQGMKKSFEIVAQEEKILSEEKIELIKEEALFGSLVELRQIISELANGEGGTTNSDTYVSYYLARAKNFNDSGARNGLQNLAEKKPFFLSAYDYAEGTLLKNLGLGNTAWFPFIYETYKTGIGYIESRLYATQSISALQQFPAYEFMKLYSDLGGTENSAFKRFADLMNRISKNLENSEKVSANLWKETENERTNCKKLLEELEEITKYSELYSKLLSGTVSTKASIRENFEKNDQNFFKLREKKAAGSLRLGEEASSMKKILNNFIGIKQELEFQKSEFAENLSVACDKKMKQIKEEKVETNNTSLLNLHKDVLFFCSKTIGTEGIEKLGYCKKAVENYELLHEGLRDYKKLEAKKIDSTGECFSYLEAIFKQTELRELENLFDELKSEEVTKENILYFDEACQNIKRQVENDLKGDYVLRELGQNYSKLKETLSGLQDVQGLLGEKELEKSIESLKGKVLGLEKYFSAGELKMTEVLPVKDTLNESIKRTLAEESERLEDSIIQYAQKSTKLVVLSGELPRTNSDFNSLSRLIISNPFSAVNKKFQVKFKAKNFSLVSKDGCVESVSCENDECTAFFSLLPNGGVKIDFYSTETTEIDEEIKVVFASNEKSLFQKKISLRTEKTFPKIIIQTKKPVNTSKTIVLVNENEVPFSDSGGSISFAAETVSKESKISAFFYADNIISIETVFLEKRKVDYEKEELVYAVKASNNFDGELNGTIILSFPLNNFIEEARVYDEEKVRKNHEVINEKIVLKEQKFLSRESREYGVFLIVNNIFNYYSEALAKLREELYFFGEQEIANEINKFLELDFGEEIAPKAEELIKRATARLAELNKQKEELNLIYFSKEKINSQLKEMKETAAEMAQLGLKKQAEEMNAIIKSAKEKMDSNSLAELSKAQAIINEKSFSIDKELSTEAEKYWKEIQDINVASSKIDSLKEEFFAEKEIFDEKISINPSEGKKQFIEMKKTYDEIMLEKASLESKKNSGTITKEMVALIKECKKKIDFLTGELSADEKSLIRAKFIQPITISRLKKIELTLIDLNSSGETTEEKERTLQEISVELNDAIDSLKRQAVKAYNTGIDSGYEKEILLRGRELIDSNQYTGAIIALSGGTGLMGLGAFENIPFAGFIPIIAVIIVAAILKQKLGKREKRLDESKKIIIKSWDED